MKIKKRIIKEDFTYVDILRIVLILLAAFLWNVLLVNRHITYIKNVPQRLGLILLLCLCVLTMGFGGFPLYFDIHIPKRFRKYSAGMAFIIQVIFGLLIFEYLSQGKISGLLPVAALLNIMIIAGIAFTFILLTGRLCSGLFCTNLILFSVGLLNHFVLQFRKTVILPSDIYAIRTAANVAENYPIRWDNVILSAGIFWLVTLQLEILLSSDSDKVKRKWIVVPFGLLLFFNILVSVHTSLQQKLNVELNQFQQTVRSQEIGFLNIWKTFIKLHRSLTAKPAGV